MPNAGRDRATWLEDIKADVLKMFRAKHGLEADDLKPENTLTFLELDSLDKVDLVLWMEKEYKISISEEEERDLHTIGDIYTLALRKVGV